MTLVLMNWAAMKAQVARRAREGPVLKVQA